MGWVAGRREFEDVEIGEQERVEERCVRVMQAVVVDEVAQSTQTLPLLGRDRQRPFVEEEGPWDPRWLAAGELGRRPHPRPRQLQPRRKKIRPRIGRLGPGGVRRATTCYRGTHGEASLWSKEASGLLGFSSPALPYKERVQ
jgi:hypothetical protein